MSTSIDPGQVLAVSDDVISSEVDGEVVLIGITTGLYYGLDVVASEIWRRLQQPKTLTVLCSELTEACEGDPETIASETKTFVETLVDRGLVRAA